MARHKRKKVTKTNQAAGIEKQRKAFKRDREYLFAEEVHGDDLSEIGEIDNAQANSSDESSDESSQESSEEDSSEEDREPDDIDEAEQNELANTWFHVDAQEGTAIDQASNLTDDYSPNPDEFQSENARQSQLKSIRFERLKNIQRMAQDPEEIDSERPSTSRRNDSTPAQKETRKVQKSTKKRKTKQKESEPKHDFPRGRHLHSVKWEEGAKRDFNDTFEPEREYGPSPETVDLSPLELFDLMWTELRPLILDKANIKGKLLFSHLKVKKWREITFNEFDLFLAIFLSFGLNPKRRLRDYWKNNSLYGSAWYKTKMTCDRFEKILASLAVAQEFIRNDESSIFASCWALVTGENVQETCDFTNKSFILDTDSHYTMVGSTDAFRLVRVWVCGTIAQARLPKWLLTDEIKLDDGTSRKMKRGESKFYTDKEKTMQLMVWKDNKIVQILTTIPHVSTEITSSKRKLVTKKNGKKVVNSILVDTPEIVQHFNMGKAATDTFNENTAANRKHMKSRDWTRPVFVFCLESSVVNCMIISNENALKTRKLESDPPKWNNRSFREKLIESLLERAGEGGFVEPAPVEPPEDDDLNRNAWMGPRGRKLEPGLGRRDKGPKINRMIPKFDMRKLRKNKKILHVPGKGDKDNSCIVHKQFVKTNIICMTCHVPLCLENCWIRWHKFEDYVYDDPLRQDTRVIRTKSTH